MTIPQNAEENRLSRGDFAKRIEKTLQTLIKYEKKGIVKPREAASGERFYLEVDVTNYWNGVKADDRQA